MGSPHPASPQARQQIALGVIGGSGLYAMPGLQDVERVEVETPFETPSVR